jgi:hypothetical protein
VVLTDSGFYFTPSRNEAGLRDEIVVSDAASSHKRRAV